MNTLNGFIKLHRKFTAWRWYQDPVVKDVFLHLLLTANFKKTKWRDLELDEGQLVISYQNVANELGIGVQRVRTAINKLKLTHEITSKSTNKFTVITIVNWREYQLGDDSANIQTNTQTNKQLTNNQQTTNKQLTNNQQQRKNDKNDKNVKNDKKRESTRAHTRTYGQFQNVFLTDEEMHELWKQYPDSYERKIERLSQYIESTGKRYDNHYATLLSWLEQDEKKETAKPKRKGTSYDLKKITEIDTLDFVDDENFGKKKPEPYVDPFTGEIVS